MGTIAAAAAADSRRMRAHALVVEGHDVRRREALVARCLVARPRDEPLRGSDEALDRRRERRVARARGRVARRTLVLSGRGWAAAGGVDEGRARGVARASSATTRTKKPCRITDGCAADVSTIDVTAATCICMKKWSWMSLVETPGPSASAQIARPASSRRSSHDCDCG